MYIKCDVVLDELKLADIAEKHVTYKTLCNLRILNKFTMYCEIRKRKSHLKCSKSDYNKKKNKTKKPTVSFNCHIVNLVFTVIL